jgi:hypothetical protein
MSEILQEFKINKERYMVGILLQKDFYFPLWYYPIPDRATREQLDIAVGKRCTHIMKNL